MEQADLVNMLQEAHKMFPFKNSSIFQFYRRASALPWKRSLPNNLHCLHPERPRHMAGWAVMVVEQKIQLGNSRASSAYLDCDKSHHPWDEDTARLYSFQLHFAHLCLRFRRQKLHFCKKVVRVCCCCQQFCSIDTSLIWIWNAPCLMFTLRASAKPAVTMPAPPPLAG